MQRKRYVLANSNYSSTEECSGPAGVLPIYIGDRLCVTATKDGWCYGYKVDSPSVSGLFPEAAVKNISSRLRLSGLLNGAINGNGKHTDDLPSPSEGIPLAEEIGKVLQSWWSRIKDLYAKNTELHWVEEVLGTVDDLLRTRKKLLAGGVPSEEIAHLNNATSSSIDRVNMLLSLNVVIRKTNGQPTNLDDLSLIELYDEHKKTQLKMTIDPNDSSKDPTNDIFSILFEVNSVTIKERYDCELSYQIYDLSNSTFLSEPFRFIWNHETQKLRDANVRALFYDLNQKDKERRLILLARVARIAPIESTSGTLKKQLEPGPQSLYCRQLIAFDIIDLKPLCDNKGDILEKIVFFNRDDSLFETLKKLNVLDRLTNIKNATIIRADEDCKAMISLQRLNGAEKSLKTKFPHVFARSPPAAVLRTSLSMVTINETMRNDFYLTLVCAEIYGKFTDKNIECRLSLLDCDAQILEKRFEFIEPTGNMNTSSYHSYVVLHEEKPKWLEPIKIKLPESINLDVHLRFTFHARKVYDKNKPEKGPVAIAFLKLLDQAIMAGDNEYELLVYKVDSQNYDEMNTSYLDFPESKGSLGNNVKNPQNSHYSLMEKGSFVVRTQSCTNFLTHDKDLLNIFRWKVAHQSIFEASLVALTNRSYERASTLEVELMKNMVTLLDTFFEAMNEKVALKLCLFDALVAVLRLADDQPKHSSSNALKNYISRFPFTTVAPKLIEGVNHYLSSADTSKNDKTMNTLKMFGILTQLIVKSKLSADQLQEPVVNFSEMIDSMLDSFVRLMGETKERMAMQNKALRHFPDAIPYLVQVFDTAKLTRQLVRIIDAFGPNIVQQERLHFVGQIVQSELFLDSFWRNDLFVKCIEQLLARLDVDELFCKEAAKAAVSAGRILGTILDQLWPQQRAPIGSDEEFGTIVENCYRPLVKSMVQISKTHRESDQEISDGRGLLFAVILALFNRMSAQTFVAFLEARPQEQDKMDLLLEMLQMLRDCLGKSPYPQIWAQMTLAQNKVVHKTLRFIMSGIQKYFTSEKMVNDMYDLAQEYILTVVCFISQVGVNRNGDGNDEEELAAGLRRQAAKDLRSMWFRLTPSHKMQYIPRLVGSFLQVALIPDEQIREATIPIFFDMMQSEYQLDLMKSFSRFSDEFISQLDQLVMKEHGTRSFQRHFVNLMNQLCQSDKELWNDGGKEFVGRIKRLLGHLFEYRYAKESADCIEIDMSRTVQLLRFYEQYDLFNLQIAYVYKLYELHMQYGNDIEAAKALLMHADKLSWEERELPEFLIGNSLNRHCATERQLKEQLLLSSADLYSKGDMWENSVAILRQLQEIYYTVDYDYEKMAELLVRQADLFKKIDKEHRAFFYFYLVAFYGKGYPSFLNGKKFVFRSDQLERHPDFLQRMKQMYGNPDTHTTMDDCSHLENSSGRHLQIFKVDPVCPSYDLGPTVNPAIKEYYRNYNIQKFEYCRTHLVKESKWTEIDNNELLKTWVTKRIVAVAESLPSVLRFSQAISVSSPIEISPLALAVQGMRNKNEKLTESAIKVLHNPLYSTRNFAGDIQGVVQAAVMGGVKNYEVFFDEKCSNIYDAEEKGMCLELRRLIIDQLAIVEYCIYAHGKRQEADRSIHNLLVEGYREHKDYVERKFGKASSLLPQGASIYDCAAEPLPNPSLGEKDKKPSSMSLGNQSVDEAPTTSQPSLITTGSNTLKKGFQKFIGSTPRKSFSQLSTTVIKHSEKPVEMFDRVMKTDSLENIKRYVKNSPITSPLRKHYNSQSSLDGVKLRTPITPKSPNFPPGTPPQLPQRLDEETPNSTLERPMKKAMMPKPLPPTPSDL
ncbi:unnamed protein product, partial [Mesorhabditis belari]|uniref:Dedicator of cytokinesis protein 1 n=1 Tax=Mesorhabditis belari TaxID=2138241 RepID=A0AAF3EH45_9BILA